MWMATRSNSRFRHEDSLSSMMSLQAINFQSNTSSEMTLMGPYFGMSMINAATTPGLPQAGNSSNPIDSVSGKKLDTSMASEWSTEEQYKLEDGFEKYRDKPSIMKYIKIAATLPDKTVRDVALRCRWMTRKRRKSEEINCGKKINSSKDKQAELPSTSSIPSLLADNRALYPFLVPSTSSNKQIICEDLSGNAINLLEQNIRAFSQIKANLSSYKVEDNLDIFFQTRNNLIAIQNDMNNMPGLMRQMPPLTVTINDDLSFAEYHKSSFRMFFFGDESIKNNRLSIVGEVLRFNTMQTGGFHTKQEHSD